MTRYHYPCGTLIPRPRIPLQLGRSVLRADQVPGEAMDKWIVDKHSN